MDVHSTMLKSANRISMKPTGGTYFFRGRDRGIVEGGDGEAGGEGEWELINDLGH
jgi:hypothetical protein